MFKRECRAVARLLWDYAGHRLCEADVDRVAFHLARCGRCREELRSYKVASALISTYRQEKEPETRTTWHSLRSQLEHEKANEKVAVPVPARRAVLPIWVGVIVSGAVLAAVWTSFQSANGSPETNDFVKRGIDSPLIFSAPDVEVTSVEGQNEAADVLKTDGPRIEMVGFGSSPPGPRRRVAESEPLEPRRLEARRDPPPKPKDQENDRESASVKPEPEAAEPRREFVMGGIPASGSRMVSGGDTMNEAPVW